MPLPALHQRTIQATDKNVPTDCVCSGAQRAPSRGDSTAAGHWCTAALPDVSLRGPEVAVAISQCPVESLENLRRKRKPFHRDSFCQNVFDISGKGGYNKDVETQTVATNITYLFPICELDHSQISESSGCDRRLTFFLSEANRRSGRDAR